MTLLRLRSLLPPEETSSVIRLLLGVLDHVSVLLVLATTSLASCAVSRESDLDATLACPANVPRRNASHQSVVRDVLCDNRAGGDKSPSTYRDPAYESRIGADAGPVTYNGRQIIVARIPGEGAPRNLYIGEDHTWSTKHIIFKNNPFVQRYVVLDLAPGADDYLVGYVHVLAEGAFLADLRLCRDMAEVPNTRTLPDACAFIDHSRFMRKVACTQRDS